MDASLRVVQKSIKVLMWTYTTLAGDDDGQMRLNTKLFIAVPAL